MKRGLLSLSISSIPATLRFDPCSQTAARFDNIVKKVCIGLFLEYSGSVQRQDPSGARLEEPVPSEMTSHSAGRVDTGEQWHVTRNNGGSWAWLAWGSLGCSKFQNASVFAPPSRSESLVLSGMVGYQSQNRDLAIRLVHCPSAENPGWPPQAQA